jgi:hypothetical protein
LEKDWKRLEELLDETKPNPNEEHDLRIFTTAFAFRVDDDQPILKSLSKLLVDRVKISILLINPRNVSLADARFRLRADLDKTMERRTAKALDALYDQILWLSDEAAKFPSLKIRFTNTMPSGFLALNAHRALLGLFVATTSYARAPHIEAGKGSVLWKTLKKEWDDRWTDKETTIDLAEFRAFGEFWGYGASQDAKIIVQSDNIETLGSSAGLGNEESCLRRIRTNPSSRVFKARTWVDDHDVRACIQIRDHFHKQGIPAPGFVHLSRKRNDTYPKAPFVVSLGLGFTDETRTIRDRCEEWLRIPNKTQWGDVLSLNNKLLAVKSVKEQIDRLKLEPKVDPENSKTFQCFIPVRWTLDQWLGIETYSCPDYAIILRYTIGIEEEETQHHLVAAGFTERSTFIAARYLAENWKKIYDDERVGGGDFLVVTTGPSNPSDLSKWSSVKHSCIVTPKHVLDAGLNW